MKLLGNKKNVYQKIIVTLLGIVFSTLILELGLRLGGFLFTTLQECNNRISFYKKGTYRIMCLGESTTAGQYPHFLEEILNQCNIGIKFSVIDKGIPAINTINILSQLEKNLNTYKPDMVITMMGNNDSAISYYKDIPEANRELFQHCSLYRFIRSIYMHIVHKLKKEDIYGLDKAGSKRRTEPKETPSAAENKFSSSEESFKKAIALNPKNDGAYVELGWLYRMQGKFPEAEELFKKAIALNPKNDKAYVELGWLYRRQGKFPEAEEPFKKAIALNPENDEAYFRLGWLYRLQRKPLEAEEVLKKAIALNPKNDGAYVELGWLYRLQDKFPQAEEVLKKAIALNPKNDNAYVGLGWLYRQQDKFPEAEELFKKAVALNPEDDLACRALGSLYREMNRIELVEEYNKKVSDEYRPLTVDNYRRLKTILDRRAIRLVCVQYPMRSVEPLKQIFEGERRVIFVDNERVFKEAVIQLSYREYFRDMFAGDFGHCTSKGNRLLAENIANVILKEIFGK